MDLFFVFYFLKMLFIHERHRERERGKDTGRGRSRLHAGSLMWDSILVSRIIPQAAGSAKPLRHGGCPRPSFLMLHFVNYSLVHLIFFKTL